MAPCPRMDFMTYNPIANELPPYQGQYRRISLVPATNKVNRQHNSKSQTDLLPRTTHNRRVKSAHSKLFKSSNPTATNISTIPFKDLPSLNQFPDLSQHPSPQHPVGLDLERTLSTSTKKILDGAIADDGSRSNRALYVYSDDKRQLGPYMMERKLGQGSFSDVMSALDTRTGQRVALKMMDKTMLKDSGRMQVCVQREIEIGMVSSEGVFCFRHKESPTRSGDELRISQYSSILLL